MKPDTQRSAFPADVLVYKVPHLLQLESAFVALRAVESVGPRPSMLVLRLEDAPILDDQGTRAIAGLTDRCRRSDIRVVLVGVAPQALAKLKDAGVAATLGEIGFCRDLDEARQVALEYADARRLRRPSE
jgi:SulP family sulfate permease